MNESFVTLDATADGIATVTLNRPQVHNAFNDEFIEQLSDIFDDLSTQDGLRAVFIEARGDSFCAGGDLNWMRRAADYGFEENRDDAMALGVMLRRLNALRHPTIALVQGPAYGGGVGLVAACDIAVSVRSAKFSLSEVRLGLIPATIGPYVLAAMGQRMSRRYFLTAERFDAETAHRMGFVHELVDDAAGLAAAKTRFAEVLKQCAPAAVANAKEFIFAIGGREIDEELVAETARRIAEQRATPEGREGVTAFLEKRKPDWVQ